MVPPQLCLLVYKPYLHPLTILVISTINHRIQPLLRQLITGLVGKSPETMVFHVFSSWNIRFSMVFLQHFPWNQSIHSYPTVHRSFLSGNASSRILHGVLRCVGHGLSVPWPHSLGPGDDDSAERLGIWEVHILVGGLEHFLFSIIYGIILPIA